MAKVSSESVSKAIQLCQSATEMLNSTASTLQGKYQAAGSGWKDSKYNELGGIISECINSLRGPIDGLANTQSTLSSLLAIISEYESQSIS